MLLAVSSYDAEASGIFDLTCDVAYTVAVGREFLYTATVTENLHQIELQAESRMVILAYFKDLIRVFFKWWWAVFTAVATFLPFFTLPSSVSLSKDSIALIIFGACLLLFLTISVVNQGYRWYLGSHNAPKVETCFPAVAAGPEREASDEVITISSVHELEIGQILTVFRATNRGVGCFGIVKVDRRLGTESTRYQCSPLWIAPIHKNDLARDQVQISQLSTSLLINYNDLANYIARVKAP